MTDRRTLPNRRPSELVEFEHDSHKFQASLSWFEDGTLAEIFLQTGKSETALESIARDLAVTASLALQHGCPSETLRHALTRTSDGRPAGPLGALLELVECRGDD